MWDSKKKAVTIRPAAAKNFQKTIWLVVISTCAKFKLDTENKGINISSKESLSKESLSKESLSKESLFPPDQMDLCFKWFTLPFHFNLVFTI